MVLRFSVEEVETFGLNLILGLKNASLCPATKTVFFRSHYGVSPAAYAAICSDLQDSKKGFYPKLEKLLIAGRFMFLYETMIVLRGATGVDEGVLAKWIWEYVRLIQGLKNMKIVLEDATESDKILALTVDGVHFRTREVRKEPSSSWYSHKHKGPGLTYEVGISIWDNKLVWVNGPFRAGKNDIGMFCSDDGLESKIPDNKFVLGDSAYKSSAKATVKKQTDSRELKEFKNRALARHETFNGRIKCFNSLENRWKHCISKHKSVMEAVCILVQYDMENGNPLFEVY